MNLMTRKEYGTMKVRYVKYKGGEGFTPISLMALVESLHISLM